MSRICVVGTWHQASVVGACLADMGHRVAGVGDDTGEVESLSRGRPLVYEPGLAEMMRRNMEAGRLRYTADYKDALDGVEIAFIAIDTPVDQNDESDLNPIFDAARSIALNVNTAGKNLLIVAVSAQVPVGTCDELEEMMRGLNPDAPVEVAYVPEFLRLGTAIELFMHPDRVAIGAYSPEVAEKLAALYEPLGRPIVKTDRRSAEMAKHAANAFLATSISFINEIADLCDEVGADALEVAQILKLDRRIGRYAFLSPGLGFAGGTLGRELRALQKLGGGRDCPTPLVDTVMEVNLSRPKLVGHRLKGLYDSLDGLRVGILGLTYKPGTSTMRRAISLEICGDLAAEGARLLAFDPLANLGELDSPPPFEMRDNPYDVALDSDALVLITPWKELAILDLGRVRSLMRRPVFIDTCNYYEPEEMLELGFVYCAIGRGYIAQGGGCAEA